MENDRRRPLRVPRATAVIGAGPAGAAAAHALARGGRPVVVFERASHIGGRTLTWREAGARVDSGAGFFTNFYPTLQRLIAHLGKLESVAELSRTNVLDLEGRRAELTLGSVLSFVRFPFLGKRDKLRMAAQTVVASLRYGRLDLSDPACLSPLDDASVRDDAVRRVGARVYEVVVRSGIEPFWYFSCDDVSRSLSLALHGRAATARFFTLRTGMDSVCRWLLDGLDVRVGEPIRRVQRRGRRYVLETTRGEEIFDDVVIATTASTARELTAPLEGDDVSARARAFLASQTYVPNVHACFAVPRAACPPTTSALFPCGPGKRQLAAISFNRFKNQSEGQGDRELVSVFLSAAASLPLLDRPEGEVFGEAWRAARELCPELPREAEPFRYVARREAIPVHAVGRYREAAEVIAAQRGPIVFAGDYLATATVDGALRSGQRAAQVLLAADAP